MNGQGKPNVAATIARLVKENVMYRETLRQIADRTSFAGKDTGSTNGWIYNAALNALKGYTK